MKRRALALLGACVLQGACGDHPIESDPNHIVASQAQPGPAHASGVHDDSEVEGVELNPGWIGGACTTDASCTSDAYSAPPVCDSRFPGGQCVQSCDRASSGAWVCPDEDLSAGSPFSTTRCIADAENAPQCVSACDFERSPTGCRPGYHCVVRPRYGTSRSTAVCLPGETEAWPGAPSPGNDMAGECYADGDCEHHACLKVRGGYCSKRFCDTAGCPDGSRCMRLNERGDTACLRACSGDSECRSEAGHQCLEEAGVCFVDATPPPHDPSVAEADCAEAWGTAGEGLHFCDPGREYYLVVNKSARNLAFCRSGTVISAFATGLGFAPEGDKLREGDGKTPEGVFYIAERKPHSQFHRAFLLSYPNDEDAERGLSSGLIDGATAVSIREAIDGCTVPPQTTALGSLIEVHGHHAADRSDWTWGCAAITDSEIDSIWPYLGVGDTVIVKP